MECEKEKGKKNSQTNGTSSSSMVMMMMARFQQRLTVVGTFVGQEGAVVIRIGRIQNDIGHQFHIIRRIIRPSYLTKSIHFFVRKINSFDFKLEGSYCGNKFYDSVAKRMPTREL